MVVWEESLVLRQLTIIPLCQDVIERTIHGQVMFLPDLFARATAPDRTRVSTQLIDPLVAAKRTNPRIGREHYVAHAHTNLPIPYRS